MEEDNKLDMMLARYKLPLAMGLIGAVLLTGGTLSSGLLSKTFVKSNASGFKSSQVPAGSLVNSAGGGAVDVSGAVKNPGVYYLPAESRVEEAIAAAGGVTNEADVVFLSKSLNLAQKITDGMKIYIPVSGEKGATAVLGAAESGPTVVSINGATPEELDTLPGVGAVTAQKIIDNRPYGSIEDLLTKKVVSRSVYDKIKDRMSI